MSLTRDKIWVMPEDRLEMRDTLSRNLGIKPLIANLLLNRGIGDLSSARVFLWGTLADLHNPFLMKGMDQAADIIIDAIKKRKKICVYGDYDVDGMTAAVLLNRLLCQLKADVMAYIPNRLDDGYSLNCQTLDELKKSGVELIVTVDCGITSCNEVAYARQIGMQVIITDHHQVGAALPDACAIINPLQEGCAYPFKKLAGVGVALKVAQGILIKLGNIKAASDFLHQELDIVALGTIADVVPLLGENRLLVKYGLQQLTNSSKSGIKALKKIVGLESGATVSVTDVAYKLAPRLNAAGRMGDPHQGFNLLFSEDYSACESLSSKLEEINSARRVMESKILEEARGRLREIYKGEIPKSIVLASEGWHVGVIGIVASRLVEEFFRPTVIIAINNGICKGSARSIPKLHLQKTLTECEDLLLEYGGHEMAAGLSIRTENIEQLRERFNILVDKNLREADFLPSFRTDGEIGFEELNIPLWQEIQQIAPFGMENPAPLFCARQVQMMYYPQTVGNNHLKLKLRQGTQIIEGIGFNMGNLSSALAVWGAKPLDVIFRPLISVWQGREQLQLSLQDIAASCN